MGKLTNLATGSVVCIVVGGILLLSHPAGAGEPWYCPKGDFVFAGTSLKAIGDAYYIYAGESEVFTARYDDLHPDFEDLPEAPFRGDPDLDAGLTPHWGCFQSPPVHWICGGGSFSDENGVNTTWTAPDTVGTYYVHLYVRDDMDFYAYDNAGLPNYVAAITVHTVKLVQSAQKMYGLWWFRGADAENYNEEVTLTASGLSEGYFKWQVTAGTDRVELYNGEDHGDTIEGPDVNTVAVKSTGASTETDDVTIAFSFGPSAGDLCQPVEHKMTVYTPVMTAIPDRNQDVPWGDDGYESYHVYLITLRTAEDVYAPRALEINERFTGFTWGPGLGNWHVDGNRESSGLTHKAEWQPGAYGFMDSIGAREQHNPDSVVPTHPDASNDALYQSGQVWRAGSLDSGEGVAMETAKTAHHYCGKGRRE